MRIAILGTGNVGTALGKGFAQAGHRVVYGSRRPAQVDCAVGQADSIPGAVRQAEVVVLAVPFGAVADALAAAGDGAFAGTVVVDATNPMGQAVPAPHRSGAEQVAALAPGSRVVKAFNTMGWETMAEPLVAGQAAVGLVCGDDGEAKETVLQLARELGFDAVDAGDLATASLLEGLATLWLQLAFRRGLGRGIAFSLLRR